MFCRKQTCYKYLSYYFALNGVSRHLYRCRLRQSISGPTWLIWYTLTHNLILLIGLPVLLHLDSDLTMIYKQKPMTVYTNLANVWLNVIIIVYNVVSRWQRERRVRKIILKLLALDERYFGQDASYSPYSHLHGLFIVKSSLVIFQLAVFFGTYGTRWSEGNLHYILLTSHGILSQCMLTALMFQYFCLLWHICVRCQQLNARLSDLLHDSSHASEVLISKLQSLQVLHATLSEIFDDLCDCFKYNIFCYLARSAWNNIATGHMLLVYAIHGTSDMFVQSHALLKSLIYILIIIDMYVFDSIADIMGQMNSQTNVLLRTYALKPGGDMLIERSCNWFALQLNRKRLSISVFGIFTMNRALTFRVRSAILLYTIFLIQADFYNIW